MAKSKDKFVINITRRGFVLGPVISESDRRAHLFDSKSQAEKHAVELRKTLDKSMGLQVDLYCGK